MVFLIKEAFLYSFLPKRKGKRQGGKGGEIIRVRLDDPNKEKGRETLHGNIFFEHIYSQVHIRTE